MKGDRRLRFAALMLAAAAVVLAAVIWALPENSGPDSGWVTGDGSGGFHYQFADGTRSFAICQETYENGVCTLPLSALVLDTMEDQGGVTPRHGKFSMEADALSGLTISMADNTTASYPGLLAGGDVVSAVWRQERVELPEEGSVILGVVCTGSAAPELAAIEEQGAAQALQGYDSASVLRLAVSGDENLEQLDDLGQRLYAMAPVAQADNSGIRSILSALGVDGAYYVVTYEQAVELSFVEIPDGEQQAALERDARLLLALSSDVDEVSVSSHAFRGGIPIYRCDLEELDALAVSYGYADGREMGRSVQGIRQLLEE